MGAARQYKKPNEATFKMWRKILLVDKTIRQNRGGAS